MSSAMMTTKLGRVVLLSTGVGDDEPPLPPQPGPRASRAAEATVTRVPGRPMGSRSMSPNDRAGEWAPRRKGRRAPAERTGARLGGTAGVYDWGPGRGPWGPR